MLTRNQLWDMLRELMRVNNGFVAPEVAAETMEQIRKAMADNVEDEVTDPDTSDGDHTFAELYEHRAALTAALMKYLRFDGMMTWRSLLHADGTMFPGYFIVGADLPTGPVTYHYEMKYWDLFEDIVWHTMDHAPEYDGHTPADVVRNLIEWSRW